MATHSSILAWKIPQTEEPGWLQAMVSQRVRRDWATERMHPSLGRGRNVNFLAWSHFEEALLAQPKGWDLWIPPGGGKTDIAGAELSVLKSSAQAPPSKTPTLAWHLHLTGSFTVGVRGRGLPLSASNHWPVRRELPPLRGLGIWPALARARRSSRFHSDPQSHYIQSPSSRTQPGKLTSFLGQLSTSHPKSQLLRVAFTQIQALPGKAWTGKAWTGKACRESREDSLSRHRAGSLWPEPSVFQMLSPSHVGPFWCLMVLLTGKTPQPSPWSLLESGPCEFKNVGAARGKDTTTRWQSRAVSVSWAAFRWGLEGLRSLMPDLPEALARSRAGATTQKRRRGGNS